MPLSSQDFRRLRSKLERAKEQINELKTEWDGFFQPGTYIVQFKDDPNTRERTYYLDSVTEIPDSIPLIIGDVIQNLRSSLDHLAHHLVCVGNGDPGPHTHVYFPIAKDSTEYKTMRDRRIKGMRQDAIDAIDAIEPYGGGAGDFLWQLHQLNIIDKHRLLLTVYANLSGHSILPSQRQRITKNFLGSSPGRKVPSLVGAFIPPPVKRFPLKAGDILLPESELEENMNFLLEIAFGEPKIVEGKPVFELLHQAATVIGGIMLNFDQAGLLQ